jgi:hypothetical protein
MSKPLDNTEFNQAIKDGRKDVVVDAFLFREHNAFHSAHPPAPGPSLERPEDMTPAPSQDALNKAIQNDDRYSMTGRKK